ALRGMLDEHQTSVGMRVQIDHLQPTAVGGEVSVEAALEKIESRRMTFTVTASDAGGLVAAGKVTPVTVDKDRFMGKGCPGSHGRADTARCAASPDVGRGAWPARNLTGWPLTC